MILSGITLALHYTAEANSAFDSVEHIMRDVNFGWLIRYLHTTGASMFFALVYLHTARSGSNNPLGIDVRTPADTLPFHPYFTMKDLFGLGYSWSSTPILYSSPRTIFSHPTIPFLPTLSPRLHTSCLNATCCPTTRSRAPFPTSWPA